MTLFREITMIDYRKPLKARAASRKFCGPYRWAPTAPNGGRGFYVNAHGDAVDEAGSCFQLRLEECGRPVTFSEFGEEIRPLIMRLPRSRGFLAGWSMGAGMCGSVAPDIHLDEDDARYAAQEEARIAAEREEEYRLEHSDEE